MNMRFFLLGLVSLVALGCGGGSGGSSSTNPKSQDPGAAADTTNGITVHLDYPGHPEKSGWVKVPPVDWQNWTAQEDVRKELETKPVAGGAKQPQGPSGQSIQAPSQRTLATVQQGTGGATDTDAEDTANGYAKGWSLLHWAASSCDPKLYIDASSYVAATPWEKHTAGVRDYYIFHRYDDANNDDADCDTQLVLQEVLLCAADRLAQLGDSPGTVTWNATVATVPDGPTQQPPVTVTIPPQRSDDIFIARDIALNALAHLVRLDTKPRAFALPTESPTFGLPKYSSNCIDQYSRLAHDGSKHVLNVLSPLFGYVEWTYFDPVPPVGAVTKEDYEASAKRRLTRKANLLISAARLTKDLIERSVQDDVAGAQQKLSSATALREGAEQAWGGTDKNAVPYNSLRHGLRTLFGRLEVGPPDEVAATQANRPPPGWTPHEVTRDDPQCTPFSYPLDYEAGGGVVAQDLVFGLPSIDARRDDVPAKTQGQSLAMSYIDRAGIVIRPDTFNDKDLWASSVKPAITAALTSQAAGLPAVPSSNPADVIADSQKLAAFAASNAATALQTLLGQIADDDFKFALAREYDAFRLLVNPDANAQETAAGLVTAANAAGYTSIVLSNSVGIRLSKRLARADLAVDPMSGLAKAQHLSSCGVFAGNWPAGTGNLPAVAPNETELSGLERALSPSGGDVTAFQNPFFLAEALRRQLGVIADLTVGTSDLADVNQFAALSAAEVRQWAGPGTFLSGSTLPFGGIAGQDQQSLDLINVSLADLGVDTNDELAERLVLVGTSFNDPPWLANCAAGLLTTCPSDISSSVRKSQFYGALDLDLPPAVQAGLNSKPIHLLYNYSTGGSDKPGSSIVLLPWKGKPGQVLGWIRTPDGYSDYFAETFSHKQRELARSVFGLGGGPPVNRSCGNVAPLTMSSDYCIAGMKKDQFVPLANELNSSGTSTSLDDSWKNYLDIAKVAAGKADQLGQELIQDGLSSDLRKESAAEALGNLCGAYVSVDGTGESGGNVTVPEADTQLKACVKPDTLDLLFLRADPFAAASTSDDPVAAAQADQATANTIRERLCPNHPALPSDPPFCAKTGAITHAGLKLNSGTSKPVGVDITARCGDVGNALPPTSDATLQTSYYQKALAEPWATSSGIAQALSELRLVEHADGQWGLWLSDNRLLSGSDGFVEQKVPTPQSGAVDKRADVWPYCADPSHHTVATFLDASGTTTTASCSKLASFVGQMFPSVPASESSPLHPALRDEVERTIFYMGALAGGVPAGVVQMPLPVENLTETDNRIVPAPALYSPGHLALSTLSEDPNDPNTLVPGTPKPLYTITDATYHGATKYYSSEPNRLGFAKAFSDSSASSAAYIATRTGDAQPAWRRALYRQIVNADGSALSNNHYLYVDALNAPIRFDPSLVSGGDATKNGRTTLPDWLSTRGYEYSKGDASFLTNVEQATFLTAAETNTDDPAKPPPQYQFCRDTKLTKGRSVCTQALVSPIFYESRNYLTDGSFVSETCHVPYVDNKPWDGWLSGFLDTGVTVPEDLFVTATPASRIECTRGYKYYATLPNYPCTPNGNDGQYDVGDGWFSASQAAGGKQGSGSFMWVTTPNLGPTSAVPSWAVDGVYPSYDWDSAAQVPWGTLASRSIWQDRLKPSVCSPAERVELFMNNRLTDRVSAMRTLVGALGLSCVNANQHVGVQLSELPPSIKSIGDIDVLQAWEQLLGYDIDQIAGAVYLVDVPKEVADLASNGQTNTGAVSSGTRGTLLLDLSTKLALLEGGFADVGANVQQISSAVNKAKLDIVASQLGTSDKKLTVAGATIDNDRQRDLATVNIVAGTLNLAIASASALSIKTFTDSGSDTAHQMVNAAAQIASGVIDVDAANKMDDVLSKQTQNADAEQRNGEAQAVLALSTTTSSLYTAVNDGLTGIKSNLNAALQDINQLNSNANEANINLAKAQGADFMEINGQSVPNHVNTVYRRQFDITKQRYDLAVQSAKRSAYLARLAIEQRLGVRLDDLHENVGPLEAPATWVDDLCTVQGVNYNALRTATEGQTDTSPGEIDRVKGFANQYIGDYVDKLQQFVQFYNVQNPFSDAGDVAVVSLREDLPSSLTKCVSPSKNLLLFSDQLAAASPDSSSLDMISHGGWRTTGCDAKACLTVNPGGAMVNVVAGADVTLQAPGGTGRATLLSSVAASSVVTTGVLPLQGQITDSDAGPPPDPIAPFVIPPTPAPTNAVFQTVKLRGGLRHVLSWWDMARDTSGGPVGAGAKPGPYTVAVFDANWGRVAGDSFQPTKSTDGVTWSARQSLDLVPAVDGEYHVLFTAGLPEVESNAIAIANVQLEAVDGNFGDASAYESNEGSLMRLSGNCNTDTPDQFRARFDRKCDNLGCYFELRDTLNIDTQVLNQGASSLIGKLAPGNYNYRNNTVALNVVGTGVIDCSGVTNASCNGSAYVQYDLDHIAYNVPIEDYPGGTHCFDFGQGSVRGGKALASERFITLPMGSADRDMISQSPFLKPEFSGRPLSGSYRLRIHDSPQLVWKNVNDVQLVMNYGYWSRVARSGGK